VVIRSSEFFITFKRPHCNFRFDWRVLQWLSLTLRPPCGISLHIFFPRLLVEVCLIPYPLLSQNLPLMKRKMDIFFIIMYVFSASAPPKFCSHNLIHVIIICLSGTRFLSHHPSCASTTLPFSAAARPPLQSSHLLRHHPTGSSTPFAKRVALLPSALIAPGERTSRYHFPAFFIRRKRIPVAVS
jgi:hypothetical protein